MELDFDTPFTSSLSHKSPTPHRSTKTTSFQDELRSTLKDRKSRGLSYDLSDEDSEDEALASDDDLMSQFNVTMKNQNRPGSAKRRENTASPNIDRKNTRTAEEIIAAREHEVPIKPPRGQTQPIVEHKPSKEEIIFGNKASRSPQRRSPSSPLLVKQKKTSSSIADEEDDDSKIQKPWQPPSFRKSPVDESMKNSPGRRTPILDSIDESPRPTPRRALSKSSSINESDEPRIKPRRLKQDERTRPVSDRTSKSPSPEGFKRASSNESPSTEVLKRTNSNRSPSHEGFKRTGSNESPSTEVLKRTNSNRSPSHEGFKRTGSNKTPSPDIFKKSGGKHSFLDDSDEEEKKYPPIRARSSRLKDQKKSTDEKEKSEKKETSILDLITGGGAVDKEKSKTQQNEKRQPKPRKQHLVKAASRDSISEEIDKHRSRSTSPVKDDGRKSGQKSPFSRASSKSPSKHDSRPSSQRSSPKPRSPKQRPITPTRSSPFKQRDEPKDRGDYRSRDSAHEEDASSLCQEVKEDPDREKWVSQNSTDDSRQKQDNDKENKPQRRVRQEADDAIDAIAHDNEKTMRFIDPADQSSKDKKKSEIKEKDKKHRPKPRYGRPLQSDSPPDSVRSYDSASSIRQSIYDDWYKQKLARTKNELKEKKHREKEEEERIQKEKDDKLKENELSYKAWMSQRSETWVKDRKAEMRKSLTQEKRKQQEIDEKKKEADKTFKMWKERKDEKIREKVKDIKKETKNKEEDLKETEQMKRSESAKAFESWKSKKDSLIKTQVKEEHKKKRMEKKYLTEEQSRKDLDASDSYEKWIQNKEKQKLQRSRSRTSLDDETRPAWSPASKTIPRGR
ncbi:uncharacterized protein LOC141899317 isoform X1 [Tubulanus polymorphus]|uniref:uncharacterized protein LOC141899317 isoform X1 n=1 Tax=Tubulanus polymorphus TaxID=672921 RepID=UPI003DA2A817